MYAPNPLAPLSSSVSSRRVFELLQKEGVLATVRKQKAELRRRPATHDFCILQQRRSVVLGWDRDEEARELCSEASEVW